MTTTGICLSHWHLLVHLVIAAVRGAAAMWHRAQATGEWTQAVEGTAESPGGTAGRAAGITDVVWLYCIDGMVMKLLLPTVTRSPCCLPSTK